MSIINQKNSVTVLSGLVFAIPVFAMAQIGLPDCGAECGFNDLMALVNRIIQFIVFQVSVPLAALGFMWLGVQVLLHPNEAAAKSKAKEIAGNIAMGFGIILAAFLIIKFVLYQFISEDYRSFLDFIFQ